MSNVEIPLLLIFFAIFCTSLQLHADCYSDKMVFLFFAVTSYLSVTKFYLSIIKYYNLFILSATHN